MGINFKEYENRNVTNSNFTTFNEIRKAMGKVGAHPINMIAVCDNDNHNKYLIAYIVTKCRPVATHSLMTLYFSKSVGYIIYDKLTNTVFLGDEYVNTLDMGSGNPKSFFNMLP